MTTTTIELGGGALPEGLHVVRARGAEGINVLPRWEVAVLLADGRLHAEDVVGSSVALRIVDGAEETSRNVDLLVTDLHHDGEGRDGGRYTLELSAPIALLGQRFGYRVFQNQTAKEIVAEVLKDAGIAPTSFVWRLSATYEKRLYCVQYGETEQAFLERLLADEGISFWFDFQGEDKPVVVFADDKSAHEGITGSILLPYEDPHGNVPYRHLFALAVTEAVVPTAFAVRDFDIRAPDVPIEGAAGDGALEIYEYPANVLTGAAAQARARVRLEQVRQQKARAEGSSNCIRLQPGRVVQVEGCADDWMNRRYVVTRVEHEWTGRTTNDAIPSAYRNHVSLAPHGELAYRPEPPRTAPSVTGLEPAFTSGPGGEEIHVDDLGRVKVRFPWDRSGVTDDTSSYWVRCLQMGMKGSMLLPRVGWEVPVVYMDGNPDRPFVLGRTYNGTMVVPYGLPGASATSTLQSATSPGGGSTNEIRMGDGAGKQEMFVHASKDQTVTVGGSAKTTVGANETHDVGLTLMLDVKASQTITVGASQSVNVGSDYSISVQGARSETIGGLEHIKVTANRIVNVGGAYSELIGALYGIQCNQSNTGVAGAFTQLIGGSLNVAGGLGVSETVLAARSEMVSGSKSLVSAGGASDDVTGAKNITAGPTSETAGGNIATGTKAAGSIKVGATAKIKAGGAVSIEAPSITIQAASLQTGEFSLSGGALSIKKGTTKIKGTIERKGSAKLQG